MTPHPPLRRPMRLLAILGVAAACTLGAAGCIDSDAGDRGTVGTAPEAQGAQGADPFAGIPTSPGAVDGDDPVAVAIASIQAGQRCDFEMIYALAVAPVAARWREAYDPGACTAAPGPLQLEGRETSRRGTAATVRTHVAGGDQCDDQVWSLRRLPEGWRIAADWTRACG